MSAVMFLAAVPAAAEPGGVAVELGPPVGVAVAPPELRDWGPYQFPGLCRLGDGSIQLSFHVEADSATAYGTGELLLPSGARLATKQLPALKAADVRLPPQAAGRPISSVAPFRRGG